MIAIPVKTNSVESAVAPLFGKAKWFAIVNGNGEIRFWKNELQSGRSVIEYFNSTGIKKIVFQEMGGNPFMLLIRAGMTCYHSGGERIVLKDALEHLSNNVLKHVTPENMYEYVEQSQKHSRGGHGNGHHHEHSHQHHHILR